jgi:hypothetical protein
MLIVKGHKVLPLLFGGLFSLWALFFLGGGPSIDPVFNINCGISAAWAAEPADSQIPSNAELARIIEGYNRWAAALASVRGGGRAWVGAEGEKTRAFDFSMVMARPGRARIQGRWGSLATLFDLSGDAGGWTLYLPQEPAVVRASEGKASAGLLLPPLEIISVLMPRGIPPRDVATGGAATIEGDRLRVVVPPGRGGAGSAFHRVLWLARDDARPLRLEVRERSQLEPLMLAADYEAFEGKGTEAFPVKVKISVAEGGQWARFVFEMVRINTGTTDKQFELRIPAGTREISPAELSPDFLPEAESDKERSR